MKLQSSKELIILFSAVMLTACSGVNGQLEEARFFLDGCNPSVTATLTTNCQPASDLASDILTAEPGNVEASILSSSARLGLAKFDFLQFAQSLQDITASSDDFSELKNIVSNYETSIGDTIDLTQLQAAKDAFNGIIASFTVDSAGVAIDPMIQRAAFQLGLIQALDSFIRAIKLTTGGIANVNTTNISTAIAAVIKSDFVNSDSNLVIGGTTTSTGEALLKPVRLNYCLCSLQTGGFTAACLRDLLRCELYTTDITTQMEQDYNSSGAANAADCTTLLAPAGLTACQGTNTTE